MMHVSCVKLTVALSRVPVWPFPSTPLITSGKLLCLVSREGWTLAKSPTESPPSVRGPSAHGSLLAGIAQSARTLISVRIPKSTSSLSQGYFLLTSSCNKPELLFTLTLNTRIDLALTFGPLSGRVEGLIDIRSDHWEFDHITVILQLNQLFAQSATQKATETLLNQADWMKTRLQTVHERCLRHQGALLCHKPSNTRTSVVSHAKHVLDLNQLNKTWQQVQSHIKNPAPLLICVFFYTFV